MRKVVVSMFVTLDGVIQAPGVKGEDPSGGFEHEGWQQEMFAPEVGEAVDRTIREAGALLLGRRTYEAFAAYWPTAPDDLAEIRDPLNAMPKHVASTTLDSADWENSEVLRGDVAEGVRSLKEADGGDVLVFGSADLCRTLIANDLIDEYRLMIHPVVLGQGKRLFEECLGRLPLELVDSTVAANGVLILTYRPAR